MTDINPVSPPKAKRANTPKAKAPAAAATLAPTEPSAPPPGPKGKLGALVALLRRPDGASIADMMEATGWQAHSVRGAIAGALKKTLKLEITSSKAEGAERRYRIVEAAHDAG